MTKPVRYVCPFWKYENLQTELLRNRECEEFEGTKRQLSAHLNRHHTASLMLAILVSLINCEKEPEK